MTDDRAALDLLARLKTTDPDLFERGIKLVRENEVLQHAPYAHAKSWAEVARARIKQYAAEDARAVLAGIDTRAPLLSLTPEQMAALACAQSFECFVCGGALKMRWFGRHDPDAFSVGRILNEYPHVFANSVLVHSHCNHGNNELRAAERAFGPRRVELLRATLEDAAFRTAVAAGVSLVVGTAQSDDPVGSVEEYVATHERSPDDALWAGLDAAAKPSDVAKPTVSDSGRGVTDPARPEFGAAIDRVKSLVQGGAVSINTTQLGADVHAELTLLHGKDAPPKMRIVLALGWYLRRELGWTHRRASQTADDGARKMSVVYDAPL